MNGVPVEHEAQNQLRNVASLPFIHSHIAVMPDVHFGIGATVGSVIPTKGAIIPAAVGVDIGCGMMAVRTSLTANDLPDSLARLRGAIERERAARQRPDTAITAHAVAPLRRRTSRWRLDDRYRAIIDKHPKASAKSQRSARHARRRQPLHRGLPRRRGPRLGDAALGLARLGQRDRQVLHRAGEGGPATRELGYHVPDKDLAFFMEGEEHVRRLRGGGGLGARLRARQPRGDDGAHACVRCATTCRSSSSRSTP